MNNKDQNIGILNEVGDMGLGFHELTEKETEKLKDSNGGENTQTE